MTQRPRVDDIAVTAIPEQPAVSPDGTRVVYALRTTDADADKTLRSLWQVGAREGEPRRLTRGPADFSPAWSPDGTRVAFLRAEDGPPQVWLLPAGGGEAEQLTKLPLGAGPPQWSPDGGRIAFSAAVDTLALEGEDDKARARRAGAPIVADRLDYQADGAGLLRSMRKHLFVVDVASGDSRQVTGGDWHAGDPAWSPDSTKLAFGAATAPDADLAFRAPVYVVDATGRAAEPELVGLSEGAGGAVTWSADGQSLLVVGVVGNPFGPGALLRVPLSGQGLSGQGEPVNLAAPLDRTVLAGDPGYPGGRPVLVDDGRSVLFCARDRGCTHLFAVPVGGGEPKPVLAGAGRAVSGLSVGAGTAAVALATPTSYGEIVTIDLATGDELVRTAHGNAEVEPFPREEREFTISDGTTVQGWVVRDPSATGPRPLLLDVHGGPHNSWNGAADDVHLYHQELAARGWVVLLVNPRGSDGYGGRFYGAAVGGWGIADAKDLLEPVDALVAEGTADAARLAVTGYSYGGYMTCYLTSRDNRFAAAVAGGVVTDLTSMAGTSDGGHLLGEHELGGRPSANRERYAEMSPLTGVENVRTPTLILHGGADVRCPVGQAQQWHTALRERGVPTRLVLYPDSAHLFILDGPPSHRVDYNRRVVDWVEQYALSRRPRIEAAHWQRRLSTLAERHRVPGATLGILRVGEGGEDDLVEAAYGVVNKDTGVPVTTDTLFQIGSMGKVWTATVVMQLVDEGKLDLDAPIVEALPEFRVADPEVSKRVTMRHLLTHTSGIDGDVFTDTGRGDDCLEKYVAGLAEVPQNHPMGATWSYCNAGFPLAGRVIERLTEQTWDAAMRERVYARLGLTHTVTLPEDALLYRTAVGHVGEGDAEPTRAPVWQLPRSLGPAGLVASTVRDALTFVRAHLNGGRAAGGTELLSEASAAAMTTKQADLPDVHSLGDSWGIGWIRFGWDGRRLIGHDGSTIGQTAFLRVLPDEGLAVVLLTNGGNGRDLYQDLYREIFAELAGVAMPEPLSPPAEPVTADISRHAGTYERAGARLEVFAGEDGPRLRITATGALAELVPDPVEEVPLVPLNEDLYVTRSPGTRTWSPVTFYRLPTGEPYLHFGARATPKVS